MFQPINLPFRIRQSSLEDARCLYRFHRNHVLGLRDPESEASGRGTQSHSLAKQYADYLVLSKQEMDWSYAEQLASQPGIDDEPSQIFLDWSTRRSFEPSRIFATEYRIRLGWDLRPCADEDAVFSADIDRLEISGDTAEEIDYKTHWAAFEPTTIQAVLYPWMLWKIMPHLQTIRFTLDFMRWGILKTREFSRDQMERMDIYVQNQVSRLVEAYKADEWPASVNSKCTYCHHVCPLVTAGLSRESIGQIQSPAQAESMAQQMYALKRAYTQLHNSLRSYAALNGPIAAGNDITLGFSKQEQFEYDVRTIETLNAEHGFAHDRTLRVSATEVKKIGKKYPEFVTRARRTAKDRSKTVFKFTNDLGDPLGMEDDDGID